MTLTERIAQHTAAQTISFSTSEYGDHPAGACEAMRVTYDLEASQPRPNADVMAFAIGGYHAGWGICAGRVAAPSTFRARAAARALPAKVLA